MGFAPPSVRVAVFFLKKMHFFEKIIAKTLAYNEFIMYLCNTKRKEV